MATRVIDDSKLQDIAVAIQGKDGGGQMTVEEMPGRIEPLRNDFELLKTVTLDAEVSTIKVDIDENYNEFLFIPEIFIGNSEWVYASTLDANNSGYALGIYSNRISDYWSFAQHQALFAIFLSPLRFCAFSGGAQLENGVPTRVLPERKYTSIIFSLYNNSSLFRSGSYKLYGRKDGGRINAD